MFFQASKALEGSSTDPPHLERWGRTASHSKRGIHGGYQYYQPNERRNFDSTILNLPQCPKSLIILISSAARTDLSSRDCIARSVPGTSWLRCTSAPIHLECHRMSTFPQPWHAKTSQNSASSEQLKSSASKQNTEVYMLRWGKNAQRPKLPSDNGAIQT